MTAEDHIIAKVTEPASWISSTETIEKPSKLHFCIDTEILQSHRKAFFKKHYLTWQEQTESQAVIAKDRYRHKFIVEE